VTAGATPPSPPTPRPAHLDARHRAHARVEDRIRCAKDTGLDHIPSRTFAINQAWLTVVMLAVDLITWTQHLLLHGELAKAEPKTLRYRLLHVAARLTRGQRRLRLRIQRSWPWAHQLAAAFTRLAALPAPAVDLPIPTRRAAGATGRTSMPATPACLPENPRARRSSTQNPRSAHRFTNDQGSHLFAACSDGSLCRK
jgi:hypothetical protein